MSGVSRTVVAATRAELKALGAESSALGASALALARHVDDPDSTSAAAAAARELRMTFAALREPAAVGTKSESPMTTRLEQLRRERSGDAGA